MLSQLMAVFGSCKQVLSSVPLAAVCSINKVLILPLLCSVVLFLIAFRPVLFGKKILNGANKGPFIKGNELHTPFSFKYACGKCFIFIC